MKAELKPEELRKDLRLGNLLFDKDGIARPVVYIGDTIGLANNMGGTTKYQENPIFSQDINDLKGIELSEEWLKKADMSRNDVLWANFREDKDGYFIWVCGYKVYIKYVHTLQNLAHALTGNELIFNHG